MSSIAAFLDNPIVNSTLKLFLILYAGFMLELNSTHMHGWLQNRWFSYIFISLIMFALSKKLLLSFVLTGAFYLLFHFLTNVEKKRSAKKAFDALLSPQADTNIDPDDLVLPTNTAQSRSQAVVRRRKLRDALEEKRKQRMERQTSRVRFANTNPIQPLPNIEAPELPILDVSAQQEANVPTGTETVADTEDDLAVDQPKLKNKMQQFIDLQTSSGTNMDPSRRFIDVSIKKENLAPYNQLNKHHLY